MKFRVILVELLTVSFRTSEKYKIGFYGIKKEIMN
jgi:hypothetical protein